ncbi:MAG: hypothetical protein MUE70_16750 [Desulfobacterales bacterium]|jgi:hypothetical protein|nr:hypothetical protein [Desulfobacterales bacterium]
MARPLRIQIPGAFYPIKSRGIDRKDIFLSRLCKRREHASLAEPEFYL